jgi:hypothetical protein
LEFLSRIVSPNKPKKIGNPFYVARLYTKSATVNSATTNLIVRASPRFSNDALRAAKYTQKAFTADTPTENMFRLRSSICSRVLAAVLLLSVAAASLAHDIVGKATVLVYVKPEDKHLLVLVRAPLEALTEVQFPVRGPGYLDISAADTALQDAARIYVAGSFQFYADGEALPNAEILKTRAALPTDKSFVDFKTASEAIDRPRLPDDENVYWKQASLDVLLSIPIANPHAKFSVDPNLSKIAMETHTVLRFVPPTGDEKIFDYQGYPGRVELEPGFLHATTQFVALGFFHILDGIDHLLFLLCLAIPSRSVRSLIPAITAFTIAHSITLISAALALVPTAPWFGPLIETLIAASVFYMACENTFGAQLKARWLIVFAFGLVHGFGFSFILSDRMQFAGSHLISSLLAFNVGVELGQLLVLLLAVPLLGLFFKYVRSEKAGTILLSVIAGHTAWHWLTERGEQLLKFTWKWPVLDAAFYAAALRWAMLLMASFGVMWALHELFKRLAPKFQRLAPPVSQAGEP